MHEGFTWVLGSGVQVIKGQLGGLGSGCFKGGIRADFDAYLNLACFKPSWTSTHQLHTTASNSNWTLRPDFVPKALHLKPETLHPKL